LSGGSDVTESEWLACTDSRKMFASLVEELSERKERLFACACCRRVWHLLVHDSSRQAVEVAERHADGRANEGELGTSYEAAYATLARLYRLSQSPWGEGMSALREAVEAADTSALTAHRAAYGVVFAVTVRWEDCSPSYAGFYAMEAVGSAGEGAKVVEGAAQADLLRDLVGPLLFRPLPPVAPALLAWNDAAVKRLAEAAYEHRLLPSGVLDRERLLVLADALEDAGCDDEAILSHLRGPGLHVRGCHVLDLLLGRS
jgi:hypothetical protein